MKDYLRLIDTDTSGPRYDVTPLFADPEAFSNLVEDLLERFAGVPFDLIAGIDALGFILLLLLPKNEDAYYTGKKRR